MAYLCHYLLSLSLFVRMMNMKREWISDGLWKFAAICLMYDVYYWSMRNTAGALRTVDVTVCLAIGIPCVLIIICSIVKKAKSRRKL